MSPPLVPCNTSTGLETANSDGYRAKSGTGTKIQRSEQLAIAERGTSQATNTRKPDSTASVGNGDRREGFGASNGGRCENWLAAVQYRSVRNVEACHDPGSTKAIPGRRV